MTRFIIFRHGQTSWSSPIRYCGSNDISINEEGEIQARKLAKTLQTEKIDVIYSSPLSRAYETANVINLNLRTKITALEELKEIYLGELEGKTKEERLKNYPWFDWNNDDHRKKLNIDTISYWKNIFEEKIIPELLKKHTSQTIALSTHYFKLQIILLALGLSGDIALKTRFNPCGLTIIEKGKNKTRVICLNRESVN